MPPRKVEASEKAKREDTPKAIKKVWRTPPGPCGDTLQKIPAEEETRKVSKQYAVKDSSVRL